MRDSRWSISKVFNLIDMLYFIEKWKFTVWNQFSVSDTIIYFSKTFTWDIWILKGNHQWFISFTLSNFKFKFRCNLILSFSSLFRILIFLLSLFVSLNAQNYLSFDEHSKDCALLLSKEGRSSLFDYNVNLFRGTL